MKNYFICLIVLLTSCSRDNGTIKIKGSDTEVNLAVQLAETFHEVNSSVFVSISGGGSGLGIASLLNGTADVANSSRSINHGEIDLFKKQGVEIDSFLFAQDAIAFVVADDLPIDSISTTELGNLLNGKYKNWSSLTGKDMPVNIYGRQSNSGTHDFVKTKLGIDFTPYAKQMSGNAQILEAIRADHSGIGYVGAGYVSQGGSKGIKVLPVYLKKNDKAISPLDSSMIASGKYFFQRPLFQYYRKPSYGKIKSFLDFEKSDEGKKIIHASGYYPVK
ncbi:MAG: PstS family phosphate ABC transporter substrate-binding protein [Ferruginibacter sp.]|nr:PstS family phosphate ABC transporter substrate-binding protein [Ferruginibacter sp.]